MNQTEVGSAPDRQENSPDLHAPVPPTRATATPSPLATSGVKWSLRGIFFIGSVFLLREAQPLMVPVVVAIVLTFVLATPVRFLRRLGIPEFVGAALLLSALLAGTALLAVTLVEPATQWWDRAPATVEDFVGQLDRLRATIPLLGPAQRPAEGARPAARPANPPVDPVKEKIVSASMALTGVLIGRVLSFALSATATVLLLYFLLASENWLLARTLEAIPRRRTRAVVLSAVRNAQRDISAFLGTLSIINLGVGVATLFLMNWIRLPNPVLWASTAALLNFIPYIGPIIITGLLLLAGIVSFSSTDPALILAPPLAFLALHAVESNLVSPWLIGQRLSLSRLAVFLSVMFWGWMWGIAGAVTAVPVLIGLRCLCKRKRSLRHLSVFLDGNGIAPRSLRGVLRGHGVAKSGASPAPPPAAY